MIIFVGLIQTKFLIGSSKNDHNATVHARCGIPFDLLAHGGLFDHVTVFIKFAFIFEIYFLIEVHGKKDDRQEDVLKNLETP